MINNIIAFTIDRTVYQAEEGMTWGEWLESDYNIDGYFLSGNRIHQYGTTYDVALNETFVVTSDKIIADQTYDLAYFGGGGSHD